MPGLVLVRKERFKRKIIEGKVYDTDTAELLASYEYSNSRDFRWVCAELYRTKKGTFFLFGEGGPMSRYRVSEGNNSWSGSSKIILLTEAEAWIEEYGTASLYERLFDVEED